MFLDRTLAQLEEVAITDPFVECELRLVVARPLDEDERASATSWVREALEFDYRVEIHEVEALERGPSGKFEEFVSRIEP